MIASTPVARWSWGREAEGEDELLEFLRGVLSAFTVLRDRRLFPSHVPMKIALPEYGATETFLFRGEFTLDSRTSPDDAESLAQEIQSAMVPGKPGGVDADISPGRSTMASGTDETAFSLSAALLTGFFSLQLETFSDAWMPCDLKGRAQDDRYAANYPRLADALQAVSVAVDTDIDPDDPTWFGKPTETGVENICDGDGSAVDVWDRFEIPQRNSVFRHAPGFDAVGYARDASGLIRHTPVAGEQGVLGYLWASDTEAAASFEPRASAGDAGYAAGLLWLERLREASARGLLPSAALREFAALPSDRVAGQLQTSTATALESLAELREIASHT
ncbi:hypothetical protein ACFQVC_04630 [Streptomyces monticola]|uniref:Uncharacterized protein n=1 Tax=Streptomyces monticola TaxID=2666263 RepID=A0ABW2JD60_9ACTN